MSSRVIGGEDWIAEFIFEGGKKAEWLEVNFPDEHNQELDVPEEFLRSVDQSYWNTLVEKGSRLYEQGSQLFVEIKGELRCAEYEDDSVTVDGEPYSPENWGEERPELWTADNSVEDIDRATAERVLWDGDTIVPIFGSDGDDLSVNLVWGSYAERQAVPDNVSRFDVSRLPASMNSTMLPVVERDGEEGIAVFERGAGVGEYPEHRVGIAGGADEMMTPGEVAWLEAKEEARLLPDYGAKELRDRGIICEEMREGVLDGDEIYSLPGENGLETYYRIPPENLEMLGIVRDVDKTYAPEAVFVANTDLQFQDLKVNYVRGQEHAGIEFVTIDQMTSGRNYLPTTEAAVSLFNIHRGRESFGDYETNAPENYESAQTRIF
ncbi:MAG: hypothetical protein ABEJ03_03090 [Candidatus Nanohaloarchaea archaeon]